MAITFLATIAMLQSAIQISGDGGARLKLDIDDTGMDAVMALSAMRGELLRVTVEVLQNNTDQHAETRVETRRERQPKWTTTQRSHVDGLARQVGPEADNTP
jgi:hypothetical protein